MEKKSKKEYKDILKEDESNQKFKATDREQRSDVTEVGDGLKNKQKKGKAKGAKTEKQKVGVEKKSSKLSGVEDEENDGNTVGDSSRKRKRKNNENETMGSSGNSKVYNENGVGSNAKRGMNIDEKEERVHNIKPEKGKSLEKSSDMRDKNDKKKKDKKREDAEIHGGESNLYFLKQENINDDKQLAKCDENGLEKQDRKKNKKKNNTKRGKNIDEKEDRVHDDEPEKGKLLETSSNVREKKVNRKKDKKRKAADINGGEGDLPFLQQENVNGASQLAKSDENGVEKEDNKKKMKNNSKRGMNVDEKEDREHDGKPDKVKSVETSGDVHDKKVNRKKDKKRKVAEINGRENDLTFLKQENVGDENGVEKHDRTKKKRKANQANDDKNNPSSEQDAAVSASNVLGDQENSEAERAENGPDEVHNSERMDVNKKKKKKSKASDKVDSTPNKSNKKVRFSDQVEVFPLASGSDDDKVENLVIGKRFTPEEDEIVKKAVYNYIEENNLGEEGLEMVLNSRKHSKLRGCWKEIARAIPYRPYTAVYFRAQILFRRSETRAWTQEEYDMILAYQQVHGNQWKALADELGKHHWHVKDTYRRIKLRNRQKGQWSQEEYQTLFDLVNTDLQLKISEEKKSKHGMLRDNICWSAISERMETRATPHCCMKWYRQLSSPMVVEGIWADADDYRLIAALYSLDENCMEDVDWDDLIEGRSGEVCRKRWTQMRKHIGHHGKKTFAEQVEVLAQRYCPHLLETREAWDSKPRVP